MSRLQWWSTQRMVCCRRLMSRSRPEQFLFWWQLEFNFVDGYLQITNVHSATSYGSCCRSVKDRVAYWPAARSHSWANRSYQVRVNESRTSLIVRPAMRGISPVNSAQVWTRVPPSG